MTFSCSNSIDKWVIAPIQKFGHFNEEVFYKGKNELFIRIFWINDHIRKPIFSHVSSGIFKTAFYVRENWKNGLIFIAAWTFIIGGTGLMYGFKAVALPLAIGVSSGIITGVFGGIIVVLSMSKDEMPEYNTIWKMINAGLNQLSPNGTRPIVISVATTVILASVVIFPLGAGFFIGILIGNHIATEIGTSDLKSSERTLSSQITDETVQT